MSDLPKLIIPTAEDMADADRMDALRARAKADGALLVNDVQSHAVDRFREWERRTAKVVDIADTRAFLLNVDAIARGEVRAIRVEGEAE